MHPPWIFQDNLRGFRSDCEKAWDFTAMSVWSATSNSASVKISSFFAIQPFEAQNLLFVMWNDVSWASVHLKLWKVCIWCSIWPIWNSDQFRYRESILNPNKRPIIIIRHAYHNQKSILQQKCVDEIWIAWIFFRCWSRFWIFNSQRYCYQLSNSQMILYCIIYSRK